MGLTLGAAALGLELDAGVPVPSRAPELVVTLNASDQLLLSKYRGKVVALEFLLTTCPHCQHASAILEKIYKEYAGRGFQVIGAAINDNALALIPEFISKLGLTFPVGAAPRDMSYDFLHFDPNSPSATPLLMPQLVFIDRRGIVRAYYPGDSPFFRDAIETNMRNEVESLLKAGSGAPAKKAAAKSFKSSQ